MYMLQIWCSHNKLDFRPEETYFYLTEKTYETHGKPKLDRRRNLKESPDSSFRTKLRLYVFNDNNGNWDLHLEVGPVE